MSEISSRGWRKLVLKLLGDRPPSPTATKRRRFTKISTPGQPMTRGTTTPLTVGTSEGITRRSQSLALESRETGNTGGFMVLVTSFEENSNMKMRTHEAKIK
jgi:hypothetical protein